VSEAPASGERPAIERLTPADVDDYRALMLSAYDAEPDAFTSNAAERGEQPPEWWLARVSDRPDADELVLGARADGGLVAAVGVRFRRRERTRHKATLFGLFVADGHRGQGLGRTLVEAALEAARARAGTLLVQLTVAASNEPAVRLYRECGFEPFGTEPLAWKRGDRYESLLHMWREL